MKKLIICLLILISILSFSYIYFRTENVLVYPKNTVYFSTDEKFSVQIYYFKLSQSILNGILGSGNMVDYSLKKIKDEMYSIELPDIPGAYFIILKGTKNSATRLFFFDPL